MKTEASGDVYSKPGYARTRNAYIGECAFEYFIALLVADPFLTKLLLYIGLDDATVSVIQSLISVAFLFQLCSLLVVQRISNVKRVATLIHCIGQAMFLFLYLVPFLPFETKYKGVITVACFLVAYLGNYMVTSVIFRWGNSFVDPGRRARFAATKEMVEIAHSFGATVEGEIGHVGNADTGDNDTDDMYTTPKEAVEFIEKTGVDALAIAVGNAHGAYKLPPKLDFERIRTIAKTVDVPLVLHGGSGLTDDDFRKAIQDGISKVNIFTDINVAAVEAEFKKFHSMDKGLIDLIPAAVEAVKLETSKKMKLFSSDGKAGGAVQAPAFGIEELTKLVAEEVAKYMNK